METTTVAGTSEIKGMGWLPDRPDVRDYVSTTPEVQERLAAAQSKSVRLLAERAAAVTAADGASPALAEATEELPAKVDLREWFPPVEDQESIGSCTANAACGIVEYYQRRTHGKYVDMSRLFLYKVTRKLLGLTGDTGAYLRSTMGALALFGAPPERYWPYDIAQYEEEPPAFAYAFGDNFEALAYYRLDPTGSTGDQVLAQVKSHVAAGQPAMFGFTVYASIQRPDKPGEIPFPSSRRERARRARDRGRGVRRRAQGQEPGQRRLDHGRVPHPQLVGDVVGRGRLRLAAVRVRAPGARRGLVGHDVGRVDRLGGLRRVITGGGSRT